MNMWLIAGLFVAAIALVAVWSWWSIKHTPPEAPDHPGEVEVYRRSYDRGGL